MLGERDHLKTRSSQEGWDLHAPQAAIDEECG